MKRTLILIILALTACLGAEAQKRKPQNKPYIDLRPMHFGIHIGLNVQDLELQNVGPQDIVMPDGSTMPANILVDCDVWNPGFSVGVLADMRLSQHFSLRIAPTMHFGSKHLVFRDMLNLGESGRPTESTQDMKNTYISVPIDLKFAAQRFNNYRPYVVAGVNPMLNLSSKDQDFLQLKRYDTMVEVGLGCDFYLPFFKFVPELKFCFSLIDALDRDHWNELTDINKRAFAQSMSSVQNKMIVLTLYFE